MKKWYWTAVSIILLGQIIIAKLINYPPTLEQLKILNWLNLNGEGFLWILKFSSLGMLLLCFWMFKKFVPQNLFTWIIVLWLISPMSLILWMLYPLTLSKVFLIVGTYFLLKNKNKYLAVFLTLLILIFFNLKVLENHPAVFNKISLRDAKNEVTARFTAEDSLMTRVRWPLWWRRIGYNKYFFAYKQIIAEVLPFFDLETSFFQEVTPTGQKSIVMWYWPEFYLFLIGIFFLLKKENGKMRKIILGSFGLALINFVFSEGAIEWRLLLIMWPTSIILALGMKNLINKAKDGFILAKIVLSIGFSLLFLAWGFNNYDLLMRKEYWLDNRPLAFEFWYKNLNKINIDNYQKIYISSLVGDSKRYCQFYLEKKCLNNNKFIFESFNLTEDKINEGSVYAGFAGEFVGPKFKNDIDSDWQAKIKAKGMEIVEVKNLNDTIAYQYGDSVVIAIKNK